MNLTLQLLLLEQLLVFLFQQELVKSLSSILSLWHTQEHTS